MTKETSQFTMETEATKTKSPLARALTDVIDKAGLYSREDWGFILDVSEAAISQWLSDTTLPRPEMLRMILGTLKESARVAPDIVDKFNALLHKSATGISPHGSRMGGSLARYLARPLREGLMRELDVLPDEEQEQVLAAARRLCQDAMRKKKAVLTRAVGGVETLVSVTAEKTGETTKLRPVTRDELMDLAREIDDDHPTAWVVPGHRQVDLIDAPPRLRLVGQEHDQASFSIISGMYSTAKEQQLAWGADELLTCAVVIWRFPTSISNFQAFQLEEMQVILYTGRLKLTLTGQENPVILGCGPEENNIMWITAGQKNGLGLPPFKCEPVGDEPAIGIAILYDSRGVQLNPVADQSRIDTNPYLVTPQASEWRVVDAERYWEDLRNEPNSLADQLPLVGHVPSERDALHAMLVENRLSPKERDPHQEARCKKQVDDANLPKWTVPETAALHTRLIRFPECPGINEDDLEVASHPGQEIFIPLQGAFNCVYASLLPREAEKGRFNMGIIPSERRRRKTVQSTSVSRQKFPDLFSIYSESAHGFYGANGDAYCLHVRCLPDLTRLYTRYRGSGARNSRASRKAERGVA